jgi:hypothetical protein
MKVGMCRDEVILNIVTRITLPPAILMDSVGSCLYFELEEDAGLNFAMAGLMRGNFGSLIVDSRMSLGFVK